MKFLYVISLAILASTNAFANEFTIRDTETSYPRTLVFKSAGEDAEGLKIYDVISTDEKLQRKDYDQYVVSCNLKRIWYKYGKSVGGTTGYSVPAPWLPYGAGGLAKEILSKSCS